MYIGTPRIEIYVDRIETNARAIIDLCRTHGVQVACVTKVMSAHPALLHALEAAGADMIADSRITNLQSIANTGSTLPTLMLRSATPSRVADIVRWLISATCARASGLTALPQSFGPPPNSAASRSSAWAPTSPVMAG